MRRLLCGLLVVTCVGCRQPGLVGTYELEAVNGVALPVPATRTSTARATIVGGSLTLGADGSYRSRLLFRVRTHLGSYADSSVTMGSYERRGRVVELRQPLRTMVATVRDGTVTVDVEGWTYRYRRP
ncbi:MAG: hypothetical protein HY561_01975 [Gemmatimonadetes bacterium]|nr:hypothetical protein [Gemmatimonadota bacterium]